MDILYWQKRSQNTIKSDNKVNQIPKILKIKIIKNYQTKNRLSQMCAKKSLCCHYLKIFINRQQFLMESHHFSSPSIITKKEKRKIKICELNKRVIMIYKNQHFLLIMYFIIFIRMLLI